MKSTLASRLDRFRSVILGVGMSLAARGGGAIAGLISIPVLLNAFGTKQYGVWVFILSISSLMSFMDFGTGNALLNRSAKLLQQHRTDEIHRYVASSLWGFLAMALLLILALFALSTQVSFSSWLNIGGSEEDKALLAFMVYSLLSVPLAAIQRLQIGMGKGYLNPLTQLAASLASLGVILIGARNSMPLFPMVVTFALSQWVITLSGVLIFLHSQKIPIHPRLATFDRILELLREGAPFLVLQICATMNYYLDNLLIAQLADVADIAVYSVGAKVFQLIALVPSLMNTYLWPMYAAAHARKDSAFIRKILWKSSLLALGWCLCIGTSATLLFPWLLDIWIQKADFFVPVSLLVGFILWTSVESTGNSLGTVLNALSVMRFQVILAPVISILILAMKAFALREYGLSALPFAAAGGYLLGAIAPYSWILLSRRGPLASARPSSPAPTAGTAGSAGASTFSDSRAAP